jgi:hypothetical protein
VPTGCVDESTLVRFFAGDLPMDRLSAVELHTGRLPGLRPADRGGGAAAGGRLGPGAAAGAAAQVETGQMVAGATGSRADRPGGDGSRAARRADELAGVPVAVKLLRSERAAQPALMQLFTRELRVARR